MKRFFALLLAVAGLFTAGSALAWHHYGPRVSLGFNYGPYWGPGPYWWGPAYYYPPTVIVTSPPAPVQYVERPAAPAPVPMLAPAPVQQSQSANLTPGYWYYCDNPRGYYPHVKECPVPWKAVAPVPPPPNPE